MLRQKLDGNKEKYKQSLDRLSCQASSSKKRILDQSNGDYESPWKENSLNDTQSSFKSKPPVFMKHVQESLDRI